MKKTLHYRRFNKIREFTAARYNDPLVHDTLEELYGMDGDTLCSVEAGGYVYLSFTLEEKEKYVDIKYLLSAVEVEVK